LTRRGKARTFSTEELLEKLFELLVDVKDCQVIVEGIRDRDALRSLGFSRIHVLNSNFYETAMKFHGPKARKSPRSFPRFWARPGAKSI
jgi:hypothetical protein